MSAQIRILHSIAGAPNVDVYLGSNKVVSNLSYGNITPYVNAPVGSTVVEVKAAGTNQVLIETPFDVVSGAFTVAAGGELATNDIRLFPYDDSVTRIGGSGDAYLRFIHQAANAPAVDILVNDALVFRNVSFGNTGIPTFFPVNLNGAQTVRIRANVAGTSQTVIGPIDLSLPRGSVKTVFAIGLLDNSMYPLSTVVASNAEARVNQSLFPGSLGAGGVYTNENRNTPANGLLMFNNALTAPLRNLGGMFNGMFRF